MASKVRARRSSLPVLAGQARELGSRDAQNGDQDGACQPVGDLIRGQRQSQPVEHQDQGYRSMVDLGLGRTVAIDDGPHLQGIQQSIQHRQGAEMSSELSPCHQVYQLGQSQRPGQRQAGQASDPQRSLMGAAPGTVSPPRPLTPTNARLPGKRGSSPRLVADHCG
jgi:hypothetical protein